MNDAVVYARVSSKDQEREGFSIPAQQKLLREYALRNGFEIVREFVDIETAKTAGRSQFNEMVKFLTRTPSCRILIVEKTDRLYRNFRDHVTLEDLDLEIHLPKEGQVIDKNSKSQAKLMHGIQLVMARNYVENLREEVRKGMREKAEQGIYPSRPPLGYRNNKTERTIEIDTRNAPIAKRIFELYASRNHSLSTVRKTIAAEFGRTFAIGYLAKLLKNRFYAGEFAWDGKVYKGTHAVIFSRDTFDEVQQVFHGLNRPKQKKRRFAFSGLLHCAYDGCTVTSEIKKNRYIYYHCTGHRGKCALPNFREEDLANRMGQILKDLHIPDQVLTALEKSLLSDGQRRATDLANERSQLTQRLNEIRRRQEIVYSDKLDGKITPEFWEARSEELNQLERNAMSSLSGLAHIQPETQLRGAKILELANQAYFLYVKQTPEEQAKLLRLVLSNCSVDAATVYPIYRKPFDVIFQHGKTEGWCARRESNPQPLASKANALSS